MERKTFLITTVVTAVVIAGCLFWLRSARLTEDDLNVLANGVFAEPITQDGTSYLIPPDEIYGIGDVEIPALTNPTFTTVAAMDRLLGDDLYGIDVVVDGVHRYYPEQIMNWHQVVNDMFGSQSILVVHDPLSGTSVAYENIGAFTVSGTVYNNTLLMDDGRNSLWLASRGLAVVGPAIGQELKQFPSRTLSWRMWKEAYPNGEVLSAEATGYVRDYTRHPYGDYDATPMVYFPLNSTDARLNTKVSVTGLDINGEQLAIGRQLLEKVMVVNDTVGGVPIVAMHEIASGKTDIGTTNIFSPAQEDGSVLVFTFDAESGYFIDDATGSEWTAHGYCEKGSLRGQQLIAINAPEYYWFAWAAVFPNTRVNPTFADSAAVPIE